MTIHLGRPLPDASRDRPGRRRGNPLAGLLSQDAGVPSLFGLAPGGVYRAVAVAGDAVRSYRTLSPLPAGRSPSAVCFLWHCPWGRPRRVLPGTVFPWSPDFPPPPPRERRRRPSGRLAPSMVVRRRHKARSASDPSNPILRSKLLAQRLRMLTDGRHRPDPDLFANSANGGSHQIDRPARGAGGNA